MRFGLVTPVFDGCIQSLELLYTNISEQTHKNWIWMLCGNNFSEKLSKFAKSKQNLDQKARIIYMTTNLKDDKKNRFSLIANIGKRRDMSIKSMNADYFLMINADSKIEKNMLAKINDQLKDNPKDLCIFKIKHNDGIIYPKSPLVYGGIDSLNFCVSSKTAKKIGYPSNAKLRRLNDWRFFVNAFEECGGDYCFINEILGEYNGNSRYKNILTSFWVENYKQQILLEYISYCLKENYLLGFIDVLKEILVKAKLPKRAFTENKTYTLDTEKK